MNLLLIIGSITCPAIMLILRRKWLKFGVLFQLLAIVCALIFGNIIAVAIYQVIKDNIVFMTDIHAILLNPFFLVTGGYLGIYIIYALSLLTLNMDK